MYYSLEKRKFINIDHFYKLEYEKYMVYYTGLIYLAHGIKPGKHSIDIILQEYEGEGIRFRNIYGSYIILIENKENKDIFMFSDNSSMSTIFYSEHNFGDNFIEMIRGMKNPQLNKKILCEYLTLSRGYYFETFVEGIHMLKASCCYEIKEGRIYVRNKNIGYLGDKSIITDISSFFADLAKSISDKKVISALTGGYDSRLVVACLNGRLNFDLFISGNNEKSAEIKLSKKAAKSIHKELKVLSPDMKKVDKDEILKKTFLVSGGRDCCNSSGLYRIDYFQKELTRQGYEILLTGDCGDMYKDFWYKQEFPFYYKKHTNAKLFYLTRMELSNNSEFLGKMIYQCYKDQRKNIISELEKQKSGLAVRSYDRYGYIVAWKKSVFSRSIGNGMVTYSPLQELELVKYSYLQPIHLKYFNYLQRQVISSQSLELSKVPTTNGTNASVDGLSMFKDLFVENVGQLKRLFRGLKRKLGDREKSMAKVMIEDDSDLRESIWSKKALSYCKKKNFINDRIDMKDIPITLLYKIIYLYQLGKVLDA